MNITRDAAARRPRGVVRAAILAGGLFIATGLPADAAEGIASFYGRAEHGGPTASGERFDMHAMTAAHRTAPLGSHMRVTNLKNGRSVVVRINDRGPFVRGRIIDLSHAAAEQLGFVGAGLTHVSIETVAAGEASSSTQVASASEPETTGSIDTGKSRRGKDRSARTGGTIEVALNERDNFLTRRNGTAN